MKIYFFTLGIVFFIFYSLGCIKLTPEEKRNKQVFSVLKNKVKIMLISQIDLKGFEKIGILKKMEAWVKTKPGEVVVTNYKNNLWLKIMGFPEEFGNPEAGWDKENKFYINFRPDPDSGTYICFDENITKIISVRAWAGW